MVLLCATNHEQGDRPELDLPTPKG